MVHKQNYRSYQLCPTNCVSSEQAVKGSLQWIQSAHRTCVASTATLSLYVISLQLASPEPDPNVFFDKAPFPTAKLSSYSHQFMVQQIVSFWNGQFNVSDVTYFNITIEQIFILVLKYYVVYTTYTCLMLCCSVKETFIFNYGLQYNISYTANPFFDQVI